MSNQVSSLKMEKRFKKTPVGEIPVDWEVANLNDLGEIRTGGTPSTNNEEFWNGEWMFVTPSDIGDGRYVNSTERCVSLNGLEAVRKIPKNAVMVTCIASVGKIAIASADCCTNQQINSVICNDRVTPELLFYILETRMEHLKSLAGQTAVPIINKTQFSRFLLPLPPMPEQKKIAEILSAVDDAIEKTTAVIEKSRELKKGLMQQLLTRGIGHSKFKETPVGEIPVDWEVATLGNVCNQSEDKFDPSSNESVPYIGLEHISSSGDIISVDESANVKSLKTRFRAGSILFGKLRSYLRKVTMVDFDGVCSTDIMVIVASGDVSAKFILYVLQHESAINFAIGTSAGTKMPRTSWALFSKYRFPLPPVDEQKKIAEILSAVDDQIAQDEIFRQGLEGTKTALMQVLLTGKVRVR